MNEKYRKIVAWIVLVTAFAIMFLLGKFTGNGYAMLGIFLLILALLIRYGKELKEWLKFGDNPIDEPAEIIDIEPWLEQSKTPKSIILFPDKRSDN